jgi:hypothetical protein
MAQVVVAGKMAPKSFEDKDGTVSVERVCLLIMHGLEVGLTPMAALQSIAVVNGMPTIWGDGMLGLVRQSGLLDSIDETVELDEQGEPTIAICRVRRKGDANETVGSFTRAEAQKAGLWNKAGPWQQYRQRMMKMRARSWALRDKFPDVLRGLHSAEEVIDITPAGSATTAPPEPRRSEPTITDVAPATTNPTPTAGPVPPEGTAAPHAAEAGVDPPHTHDAGQPEGNERNWTIPDGLLGQDAVLKALYELLSMTRSQGDVDALLQQNAERIGRITGTRGSKWRFDVQTQRTAISQGRLS